MGTKNPSICIIGGGFSGICAGIQLEKRLGITNYKIYEQMVDFGGTWLANNYPGSSCDIPSHMYSLSFELNPNWSEVWSDYKEIWDYQIRVAKKYNLYSKANFKTRVESMIWNEKLSNWLVKIRNLESNEETELEFDFVINCVGLLRLPNIPEEFSKFTGPKFHSAEWNSSIDLSDKRVGIVGSGSSAVQIMGAIASRVKELHSFQRKPAWIAPKPNVEFSPLWKRAFRWIPFFATLYRLFLFLLFEFFHFTFTTDSYSNRKQKELCLHFMKEQIPHDPEIRMKLTPKYTVGCKRIVFSSDYYPIFNRGNVHLHTDKITEIGGNFIRTEDGQKHDLDVLILATGFRVQEFFAPLKVLGVDGVDVGTLWKENGPSTYYGIMSSLIPNNFFLLGPNTILGHNSVLYMIECQMEYTIQVIQESIQRGMRRVAVRKDVEEAWMEENSRNLKNKVWNTGCGAWYGNKNGKLTALWAKNCFSYFLETRKVNFKKLQFY